MKQKCRYLISASPFQHQFLTEVLQWRAQATPDHPLFLLLNAKVRSVLRWRVSGPRRVTEHKGETLGLPTAVSSVSSLSRMLPVAS